MSPPPRFSPSVLTATHYAWFAAGVLLLTIYGSLIPFHFQPRSAADAFTAFRQIAFHDSADLGARGDWIVSVVLFLALSYLCMAGLGADRRARVNLVAAPAVLFFCAALSIAIEYTQLFFPPRTVSLNDIIAETLGGIVGILLWLIAGQRITGWARRLTTLTDLAALARRLFTGYLVILLIVQLMPFDFTISLGELSVKYREGKIWLVPFEHDFAGVPFAMLLKTATNMACFFPVGFLKALAADRREAPRYRSLVLLLALPIVVEFFQFFVYSRVCDTTDILTGTAAILIGWKTAQVFQASLRPALNGGWRLDTADPPLLITRWTMLAALGFAWFAMVLYLNWSPFDFTTDPARFPEGPNELTVWGLRRMSWLPFVDYYWGSKYQALDQFLRKSASFIPLGILCALASSRVFRPWSVQPALCLAFILALAIESGRYFLPSRSASVTDILLQYAGAWIGFRLTAYVRARLWAESTLFA